MKEYGMKEKQHEPDKRAEYREGSYNQEIRNEREGAEEYAPSGTSQEQSPRKKKKRKKKRYLLKFFILLLLCIGIYYFLHSDFFAVKKIEVSKTVHLTSQQVEDLSGLKKGTNLFEFKAGDCEEKLQENSYIKTAEIKRKLPSTVEIQVTERQETAVLQRDKQYIVIDSEGVVLRIADKAPQVPLLIGVTVTEAAENEAVKVKEETAYKTAMKLLQKIEAADLYFKTIDVSKVLVKLYVTDNLLCSGKTSNLIIGLEEGNLKAVIYDLYKKKIKKGIVNVGDDQYYSFSKKIK